MNTQKPQRPPTDRQGTTASLNGEQSWQQLQHLVSTERISSGIALLDGMLGGKGFFRGSSLLVSGPPGAGKSSIAAHFVDEACKSGERVLYFAFDETQEQIVRDMRSIRIDLHPWLQKKLLKIQAARLSGDSLEDYFGYIVELVGDFQPTVVIVDPVTSLLDLGEVRATKALLARLIDDLKSKGVTVLMTSLASDQQTPDQPGVVISDLVDAWLTLRDVETKGERNHVLTIIKSRGMAHSNQMREYLITDRGVELEDIYLGPGQMLTGSARLEHEAQERTARMIRNQEIEQMQTSIERKRRLLEAQIAAMQAEFEKEEAEVKSILDKEMAFADHLENTRFEMAMNRKVDTFW